MQLSEFITTPYGYAYLKKQAGYWAFQLHLSDRDVLSLCHLRVASSINNNAVLNDLPHTYRTVNMLCRNVAFDLTKTLRFKKECLSDNEMLSLHSIDSTKNNYEAADLFKFLDAQIRKRFAANARYINIYETVILTQMKYEEAAEQFDMPINSVKTAVRVIRAFAVQVNKKF